MTINAESAPNTIFTKNTLTIGKLFLIYLLSNVLILLNMNGLYWDDWVLYNQSFAELKDMFSQLTGNLPMLEYIYYYVGIIGNGVFPFRIAIFISYFLSGLFLYFILTDLKFISKRAAFYISAIFLILPVNNAKIALCVAPYGFFNTIFFLAFLLLTKYLNNRGNFLLRIVTLALFFCSFYVSSFLVFYSVVLLYLLYKSHQERPNISIISSIKNMCLRYPDFLSLPLVYWFIKNKFFVPFGLYENYNHVNLSYIKTNLIFNLRNTLISALYEPLKETLYISFKFPFIFALLFLFLFILLGKNNKTNVIKENTSNSNIILFACLGFLLFFLAIIPYNVVGKIPSLYNFESRHMLVIPLGIALIIYSFLLFVGRKNHRLPSIVFLIVISSFTLKNNYDQLQYIKDLFYQASIEQQYKSNPTVKENSTFVFESNIPFAMKRSMQFYESSGRLRKVFADDKRFMANSYHEILMYKEYAKYKRYNYSSWTLSQPIAVVSNINEAEPLSAQKLLKLVFLKVTNPESYQQEVKKLTTLTTKKINIDVV